jgi:hypothetical protein
LSWERFNHELSADGICDSSEDDESVQDVLRFDCQVQYSLNESIETNMRMVEEIVLPHTNSA